MKKIMLWSAAAAIGLLAPATRAQNQAQAQVPQNAQGQNQAQAPATQPPPSAAGAARKAPGRWARTHPGRMEVNGRLGNMNRRVSAGVRDGQLDQRQARRMRRSDRAIRMEERRMARKDGNNGHLKPWQLRRLNRQENRLNRRVYRGRRR